MDNNPYKNPRKPKILSLRKTSQAENFNHENSASTSFMHSKKYKIDQNIVQSSDSVSKINKDDISLSFDVNTYFQTDNLSQFVQQNTGSLQNKNVIDELNYTCSEFQLTNPEWDKEIVRSSNIENNSENVSQFYDSSQFMKQIESVLSRCDTTSPKEHSFKSPLPVQNKTMSPRIEVTKVLNKIKDDEDFLNETISHEISQLFKSSQYKREVSGVFNKLENTICQISVGQDINLQKDDSLINSDIILTNSFFNETMSSNLNKTVECTVGNKIKQAMLNNLVHPQETDVQSVEKVIIKTDFVEMGPYYGLPNKVHDLVQQYKGIDKLYDWQDECLKLDAIKQRKNLVYALPTSGGKTLVSEILIFREILCRRKNAIFVLPYVSIVQEKVWALSPFALALNFLIEEYAAGKGTLPPRRRRIKRCVYVATIEKALGIVNSLLEANRLQEVGLVVVDELHLLGEPGRGAVLEQMLSKIIHSKEQIHIVGMSATIGNLSELCSFLNAEVYTKNFRPVELKEYVKCGAQISEIDRQAKTVEDSLLSVRTTLFDYSEEIAKIDPDRLAGLVMEVIPNGSCLIFCASKKNCENVSLLLCRVVPKSELLNYKIAEKTALLESLRGEGTVCPTLRRTIPFGVAYHHSGLTADERRFIEDAFRNSTICVICCTSTLAAGVNLPARRVILRSPYIGREFLTLARYKQMSGRAGRAGLGESHGESILICESRDLQKVAAMLLAPMERVESKLAEDDSKGLRNLVLSCIALGTAVTRKQLRDVAMCTLLAVQQPLDFVKKNTDAVITDLFKLGALQLETDRNFIPDRNVSVLMESSMINSGSPSTSETKKHIKINSDSRLVISKLGLAAIKGGLDLDTAHILYDDLIQAQGSLVLLNCLHLLYLVTPYDISRQIQPSKQLYYTIYLELGTRELQTANILGINEACCADMMTGRRIRVKERVLNRFYLTLILYNLWEGKDVFEVAEKFQVSRGLVQQLMIAAATFSANVVRFCEQMDELWAFAELLKGLGQRLQHCACKDLEPLMQLPSVKQARAKQLFQAGYRSLQAVAKADPREIMDKVEHMSIRVANQLIASAKLLLLEKVENLREEAQDVLDGIDDNAPQNLT